MKNGFLHFTAFGINYHIECEGQKWHLYSVSEKHTVTLVLTSWYPGDVLRAAIDIQDSDRPCELAPDDDTEDMPPRDHPRIAPPEFPKVTTSRTSPSCRQRPVASWNLEAELKI
jgi:hypothetical protein